VIRASLVIPSLDRQEFLLETIHRFLAFDFDGWELLVVDQTDQPSTELEALDRADERIGCLHLDTKGLPNARNVGIRHARGHIVAFVDDDVIPHPGFLEAHLVPYADEQMGGVAGRILESVERPHTLHPGGIGRLRSLDGRITRNFDSETPAVVEHAPGGNMSFRRELLLRVGGFDTRFGGTAHLEETDVSLRVRRCGCSIQFQPKACVTHLSLQTGGCRELNLATWLYWYGHNYMLFALKNLPRISLPSFVVTRLVKLIFTAVQERDVRMLSQGLSGLRDGVRSHRRGHSGGIS